MIEPINGVDKQKTTENAMHGDTYTEKDFVHLHVHTEYSLLDGAGAIDKLLDRAQELGMKSLAITDHGVMYGVIEFYQEAQKRGIKPIIGCEVYTAKRSRFDKEGGIDSEYGHLVLLAENDIGYRNLMYLVSCGFTEGFYYKPRVDFELLSAHSEGIIALSACLAGDIPRALERGDREGAKALIYRFKKIFGENNFFLELQDHGIAQQRRLNPQLIELSKETDTPLVATNDLHYIRKEDAPYQDVLMCIQTGKTVDDVNRMKFETEEFYLKSADEMASLFPHAKEALINTAKIAQRCNVSFEFGKLQLPTFDVPGGKDSYTYLKELCYDGLAKRYGAACAPDIREKLDYELSVINSMGYVDYFLITWDFIRYARSKNIMVGPGRGSAAGSLVAYCLTITSIDPVKYNLLFERFLNPERISMPDIDIDFCYERRQEVIDYVIEKYGADHVCQIITFGTMAAKAAIRDVGRALGMPYGEVDAIAKMVPFELKMTLDRALKINPELRATYESNENAKKLIDTARALEGLPRHASTHAAGVVITKEPVYQKVPVQKNDDVVTTQFSMGILEQLGVLKMDFLGLRTLTVIKDAVELANQNGKDVDIDAISYEAPKVFEMIARGDTAGVFQLESAGMTQFMKELEPENLEDIIAGISLYRPGPMDQIPRYLANKKDPDHVTYQHPMLEQILDVTYGCMIYQEQVMQIVRELGGYSLGRADLVRRAMSKKKTDVMEKERQNFIYGNKEEGIPGCIALGISEQVAGGIFDEMIDFAKYAFNKSHAAAYAVVAYQTAYMKCFYETEFMAALLTSIFDNTDKVSYYLGECAKKGIALLPPDMNKSFDYFSVENGNIRFCLAAVKNVGRGFIHNCIKERDENGPFTSLRNFCMRMRGKDINKRALENLIRCGAFDFTGATRAQLLAVYEGVLDGISQEGKRNVEGQMSLFGGFGEEEEEERDEFPDVPNFSHREILNMEKETAGLYLSGHPLEGYREKIEAISTCKVDEILVSATEFSETGTFVGVKDGDAVTIGGIITSRKDKITKSNARMCFVGFEDLSASIEVIVFPKSLDSCDKDIVPEQIVVVEGRISIKEDDRPKLIGERFIPIDDAKEKEKLFLTIEDVSKLDILRQYLKQSRGDTSVVLQVDGRTIPVVPSLAVNPTEALLSRLSDFIGAENVRRT